MARRSPEIPAQQLVEFANWDDSYYANDRNLIRKFDKEIDAARRIKVADITGEVAIHLLDAGEEVTKLLRYRLKRVTEGAQKVRNSASGNSRVLEYNRQFYYPYYQHLVEKLLIVEDREDVLVKQRIGDEPEDYVTFIQEFAQMAKDEVVNYSVSESEGPDLICLVGSKARTDLWTDESYGFEVKNGSLRAALEVLIVMNRSDFRTFVTERMGRPWQEDPVAQEVERVVFGKAKSRFLEAFRHNVIARLKAKFGLDVRDEAKKKKNFPTSRSEAEIMDIARQLGVIGENGQINPEQVQRLVDLNDTTPPVTIEELLNQQAKPKSEEQ